MKTSAKHFVLAVGL